MNNKTIIELLDKNISTYSMRAGFCSWHILTLSVIYYMTETQQDGINIFNSKQLKICRWKN